MADSVQLLAEISPIVEYEGSTKRKLAAFFRVQSQCIILSQQIVRSPSLYKSQEILPKFTQKDCAKNVLIFGATMRSGFVRTVLIGCSDTENSRAEPMRSEVASERRYTC